METANFSFEIKQLTSTGEIDGLAAAFGNVDRGGDIVMVGAFARTLKERAGTPLPMLVHHDLKRPVGVWTEMMETASGLAVKGSLTIDSTDGRDAYALARDKALSGLSIGYIARKVRNARGARELIDVDLHEVSLVTFPMNPRAHVYSVKTIAGPRDIEDMLREGGLSSRQSKAAATAAWRAINDRAETAESRLAEILTAGISNLKTFTGD